MGGGELRPQRSNLYRSSDNGKMNQPKQRNEQDEIYYDDESSDLDDTKSQEGGVNAFRPRNHPQSPHHDDHHRHGGDVTSQYENTSQQSHSQISGGFMESLSLWSARFSNLSSISNTTIEGDVRSRLSNRAVTMLLGRKKKDVTEDMIDIPTHPLDVEGGEERGDHNDTIDKGIVMTEVNNNAVTKGMIVDGEVVQQQQQQQVV